MMRGIRIFGLAAMLLATGWAQPQVGASEPAVSRELPDAQRTRNQFLTLMSRYPPALRSIFALDPTLLSNQGYLAPYPDLVSFLNAHPEISRNPGFYVDEVRSNRFDYHESETHAVLTGLTAFLAFGMAIGVVVWLVRTVMDYRRWNRLAKVQTDVHTRILDRFTANEELLAYIQSPAGSRFLQSSPITLDAGPRSIAAPLGRIMWSAQAGLVLAAAGIGLSIVSGRFTGDTSEPLQVLGALGIALGIGFVLSAVVSYVISRKLGLIEPSRAE